HIERRLRRIAAIEREVAFLLGGSDQCGITRLRRGAGEAECRDDENKEEEVAHVSLPHVVACCCGEFDTKIVTLSIRRIGVQDIPAKAAWLRAPARICAKLHARRDGGQ